MERISHERLIWLDFLKGLAILAVVANHVFNLGVPIYPSNLICQVTVFSVSLFVMCAGVSASMSLAKYNEPGSKYKKSINRIGALLGYYTIALAMTVLLRRRFDFCVFLSTWISFPAQFYFVLFFCELLLVAPIVYALLCKYCGKYIQLFVCMLGITMVAFYCMFFTRIPMIYGGGGNILGGSYLFLFSLGMFFTLNISVSVKKTLISVAFLMMIPMAVAIALKFTIGGSQALVWARNPPGLLCMTYAIVLFIVCYFLLKSSWLLSSRVVLAGAWLGKHSLGIFLYHMLVQVVLLKLFPGFSGWIWAVCCCLLILWGGVAIDKVVRRTVALCRQCY